MQLIIQNILRRKSFTETSGDEEKGVRSHSPQGIRLEGMKSTVLSEPIESKNEEDSSPKHITPRERRPVLHERTLHREMRETSRERSREETIPEEGLSRCNSGTVHSTSVSTGSSRRRVPPIGAASSGVVMAQTGVGGTGVCPSPRLSGFQKLAAASQAAVVPRVAPSGRARMTSDWRRGSMPAAALASDISKFLGGSRLQTTAMLESDEEGEEHDN